MRCLALTLFLITTSLSLTAWATTDSRSVTTIAPTIATPTGYMLSAGSVAMPWGTNSERTLFIPTPTGGQCLPPTSPMVVLSINSASSYQDAGAMKHLWVWTYQGGNNQNYTTTPLFDNGQYRINVHLQELDDEGDSGANISIVYTLWCVYPTNPGHY